MDACQNPCGIFGAACIPCIHGCLCSLGDLQSEFEGLRLCRRRCQDRGGTGRTARKEALSSQNKADNAREQLDKVQAMAPILENLLRRINLVMQQDEEMERDLFMLKQNVIKAKDYLGRAFNRIDNARFAVFRPDYALSILQVLNAMLDDPVTHGVSRDIIQKLRYIGHHDPSVLTVEDDSYPGRPFLDYLETRLVAVVHVQTVETRSGVQQRSMLDGEPRSCMLSPRLQLLRVAVPIQTAVAKTHASRANDTMTKEMRDRSMTWGSGDLPEQVDALTAFAVQSLF
ncbi:hypothetical protein K461DRAFT_86479 [Myriangium duriaei CBS 260.36]|uniref:Uncharacterized protein n=1 Tax=Myriangium duriaei CBS 260.36 TaxID=1168546 RepID=A0A9P4MQW4_9PEZI|nr:hypothetical protein K461DRAFT_86479 [Myriangium duriaei CBS 260.36]